jgi:probable addiction module antidote protein
MRKAREFDAAKYRNDPKAVAEYLNAALSTEDPFLVTRAIRTMVRAQGMTRFSRNAGMRRSDIDKTFAEEAIPTFDMVLKLLTALDIQLLARPSVKAQVKPSVAELV